MKKKKEPKIENRDVAILKDGMNGAFWNLLKGILQDEQRDINIDILNKEEKGLSDKDVSDLIRWHNFLDYVVRLPEKCVESMTAEPPKDGSEDSNDPYDSPISEVRKKIES